MALVRYQAWNLMVRLREGVTLKPGFLALWSVACLLAAQLVPAETVAQQRRAPDTYEGTTINMSPSGIVLRINVLEWSDEDAREAVVTALTDESDVAQALAELPRAGAVWRSGSAVGHTIKYAHRTPVGNGEELITIVTDKPLDSYSFKPWTVEGSTGAAERDYSVIELRIAESGLGSGTLSFGADVEIDSESHTVSLQSHDATPALLTEVKSLPKPYWAREN